MITWDRLDLTRPRCIHLFVRAIQPTTMEKPMKSESPTLLSLTDSSETEWSFYSNLRPNGSIIRKRKIDPLNEPVTVFDNSDEGPTKTRRVNPQRLAGRLDPDLVEEMEALIIPGAKMPTFPVRKDFQERYNVDRRHIYDYFHSRGTWSSNSLATTLTYLARLTSCQRGQTYQFSEGTLLEGRCFAHSYQSTRDTPF